MLVSYAALFGLWTLSQFVLVSYFVCRSADCTCAAHGIMDETLLTIVVSASLLRDDAP